jgi:hypothetical protein
MKFEDLYKKYTKRPILLIGGIHGDEPAGNLAAQKFIGVKGIDVIYDVNQTGKRRLHGVDPNRHFGEDDEIPEEKMILGTIDELKPSLVISMHEDDTTDQVYAYSSPDMKEKVQAVLAELNVELAKSAIGDKTDKGVITTGHLPTKGTLERELRKLGISSVTIETPVRMYELEERVALQVKIVKGLLLQFGIESGIINKLHEKDING